MFQIVINYPRARQIKTFLSVFANERRIDGQKQREGVGSRCRQAGRDRQLIKAVPLLFISQSLVRVNLN